VDAEGRVAIGYWASLRLGKFALRWHSLATYEPGRPPVERTSLHPVAAPKRLCDALSWRSSALGCSFRFESQPAASSLRLHEDERGRIDWQCEVPGAPVVVTTKEGASLCGAGYAECLEMTLLPWRLPMDELRWGRWLSRDARRSVVWIDWRGADTRSWVLIDGACREGGCVRDDGLVLGSAHLTLHDTRTLHERSLADVVTPIATLAKLLPASVLALREHKCCSLGEWREGKAAPVAGWSVHERVRFR
jgi:hypothetical protein